MKYKVFLNNPNRKWEEDNDILWLCLNDKFSMPYKKNQILLWPMVNQYMKEKYGVLYDINHLKVDVVTNLKEDPLIGIKAGNQTMASGNEEVGLQTVQANP